MSEVDLISFSSLVFISKTKRSSSEFVDLAAAYLENITSTLRTILSGSINMARVLASLASRETFISPFQRILIQKVFRKVISVIPFRGLRTIGPGQIHDRPADGGLKTSAIEEA